MKSLDGGFDGGNLAGAHISFVLKDDNERRRVEIYTSNSYLIFQKEDDNYEDFKPNIQHELEWDQSYHFLEVTTGQKMSLQVKDLRPTGNSERSSSHQTLLLIARLKRLCL
jgi:hypothetical protein